MLWCKTTEVECPLEAKTESESPLEEEKAHNLNMNITSVENSNIDKITDMNTEPNVKRGINNLK